MKRTILMMILILGSVKAWGQFGVTGSRYEVVTPSSTTGLKGVYILENAAGATLTYSARTGDVSWERYSNLGGGYAEAVTGVTQSGNMYSIPAESGDMGYIIKDGETMTCVWVTNYANYQYDTGSAWLVEGDCDRIILGVDEAADEMVYFTITGRREVIDRDIVVGYQTMEFVEEDFVYREVRKEERLTHYWKEFNVGASLCATEYEISPDRFAMAWGFGRSVSTGMIEATAVEAYTEATQEAREVPNEQKIEAELGGSAPCLISFRAAITEGAIYHRWEISGYEEFDEVEDTYEQTEFEYTFTDAGTKYVRFVANNAEGSCEYIGPTYAIAIGDSRLECPNAFSPGTTEGVNDEWRVSYRSIVTFECHIFNRWGQEMATLTDPSQGWDGKYKGKVVPAGVYFYVIKAVGSDGKEYKLSGDINIIGSRRDGNGTPTTTEGTEE